jgi:hypothetical protein
MTNRKPFPILRALVREGDKFTLGALRLWWSEYHEGEPQTAANDNDPAVAPVDPEVRRIEHKAETIIAAYREDEDLAAGRIDKKVLPTYSAAMHRETHKPVVRQANKSAPPLPDYVDAEAETIRCLSVKKMRAWLGSDAETLDMAIGPHTYIDVGLHVGAEGSAKTIYRAGRQEVKDVARIFWDEAA